MRILYRGRKTPIFYHECWKPGILARAVLRIRDKAVIQCECGRYYVYNETDRFIGLSDGYWRITSMPDSHIEYNKRRSADAI